MSLLSIIIPVLNDAKIIDAVNSIEKDNLTEIIVVDGKSDESILETIRNNNKVDILVSEYDTGFYDAINKGIDLANGKWIFILAADDILLVNLPDIINKYDDGECDMICGGVIEQLEDNKYRINYPSKKLTNLKYYTSIRHPATIFRKESYMKYGKYDSNYKCAGDRELFLRFYNNGAKFNFINEYLALFSFGGMSTQRPLYWYVKEDLVISDKYKTNKIKSRALIIKFLIISWAHKLKDILNLEHKMKIYSKEEIENMIASGKYMD